MLKLYVNTHIYIHIYYLYSLLTSAALIGRLGKIFGVVTRLRPDEARENVSNADRGEGFLFSPKPRDHSWGLSSPLFNKLWGFFPSG